MDFKQASNDNAPLALGDVFWINSILQQNNSQWFEGMSVPQRIIFLGIPPDPSHTYTLAFNHQATKTQGGTLHHAYDFITSWSQAQDAANAPAPQIPPSDLLNPINECGPAPGSDPQGYRTTCTALTGGAFIATADAPDMTDIPNNPGAALAANRA